MAARLPELEHQVRFTDGPEVDWEVLAFVADEGLDQCYRASLDLATDSAELDSRELLGATCELSLQRGELEPSYLFGVVARVDYLGHADHRLQLRVHVVPALALARQRRNSRIWQDRSVQDIVREVLAETLDEYDRSLDLANLQRGAAPRDYCVQYRESDYDFVCRLLEEVGVSWFFVHDGERGHEVLTLVDDNRLYPTLENLDGTDQLPVIAHGADQADVESLAAFEWSRQLTSTSAALSDFDPASPGAVMSNAHEQADDRGRVRRVYDHGQRRVGGEELGRRSRDLAEALALAGSLASCESNASIVRPGRKFTLEGVEHEGAVGEWIVTRVVHQSGGRGDQARAYGNRFECIPASVPIRPLEHTPKPQVRGPQTATVVGGGEIDVDAQGRIQVQFHWQEDPSFAAGASCRVRCAQSWAGPGWGAQFIPRVGMEVVVEFLEGNPDRPLVTGCVYNGQAEPPFALPGSSTQSGWRTNSSPGGGGSNELRFEDAVGAEEIYIHGQKDWTVEIKHDKAQTIGHDDALRVGNNRQKSVQVDESEAIGANKSITVGKDHSEAIGANMSLTIGAAQTVTIGANQQISVAGNHSESVAGSASQSVAVAKSVTVGGALATVVGGAMNTSVGAVCAEEVGGLKSVSVGASSSESVVGGKTVDAASISHSARKSISSSAGAEMSLQAGGDFQVQVDGELGIHGKQKGLIELGKELVLKVGKASIALKKNGEIVLEGTKISVKGKKSIKLKAKKIDQN